VCLALFAGTDIPDWVRAALPQLPGVMAGTDQRAGAATRGAIDLTEAVLLADRIGEHFEAAVLDIEPGHGGKPPRAVVAIDEPAVRAKCVGDSFAEGTRIGVVLTDANPTTRVVRFEKA